MIVCSCNIITDKQINEAVARLIEADSMTVLTPLKVFHALGKRPRCGNCMDLAVQLIHAQGNRLRNGQ